MWYILKHAQEVIVREIKKWQRMTEYILQHMDQRRNYKNKNECEYKKKQNKISPSIRRAKKNGRRIIHRNITAIVI